MGKRTQKLLVYLDQNFLSDMSKADVNEKVRPEFKEIYELLHQGFVDEKLVVPGSLLHDIESSLAPHLKERIVTYQHYLGQVRLYRPDEIRDKQTSAALDRFMGRTPKDPLQPDAAFLDHPDQRVERFDISVDSHLERHNFRQSRDTTANELEKLRQRLLQGKVTYDQQLKIEQETQRDQFVQTYCRFCGPVSEEKRKELTAFTESSDFTSIPLLRIEAQLLASILTRKPGRRIEPSDGTDIDALSAYAPYMDVVCTDAFMADQLRGIAKEYGIKLFHAKTSSLRELKAFLESHLSGAPPIRCPSMTAFVLPPKERRDESFQFFYRLGSALRAMGINEYGELYAFDDGAMPKYELPQLPGAPVPFYGLQDVTRIELPHGATGDEILDICRERCRSDHFILIDEYKEIPDTFMLGAAMCAEGNMDSTHGYRIFRKHR
ncbi:MAG TPA: hypothetical protein VNE63_15300 [Candidatus Acidoferrales bacterium]|jgi:hypothetical protein|nr:hypothetical protein [Candidatus Acidoferrales bacterium]